MLYINKNTYEIAMKKDNNKLYFPCDDNMAPIISLLNKKGYKTANCCEGHAGLDGIDDDGNSLFCVSVPYIQFDDGIETIDISNFPYDDWEIKTPGMYDISYTKPIYVSRLSISYNIDKVLDIYQNDPTRTFSRNMLYRKLFLDAEMKLYDWALSLAFNDIKGE